jgi:DNA-binding SARP family transcriptional activator
MARLSLSFLGPFQVTLDGQPVTRFESAKVRALLAYLAVEAHRTHSREILSGLLWPDWPQSSALANLRYALSDLRQCIADRDADPHYLLISREAIGWNRSSDHELDVAALERAIWEAESGKLADSEEQPDIVSRLTSCVPLYRGSFLEGLSLSDSPAFEEWLRAQREHLEQQFLALLQRLGEHYERTGDYAQAQRCAERQAALDPWREEAQRRLMRALALGGDRNGALAHYQAYRANLAEELSAEPAPETIALYEQIRQGMLVGPMVGPIHELALRGLASPEDVPESPRPLFVAREGELAQLEQWLGEALRGQGRVGFVVGEPGAGKTLLLREFARRAMEAHPELIVAGGNCNAYAGMGDPYLPFVETLRLLIGDIEAHRAASALSREHARRLREIAPAALQAVLQGSPELIDALLPGSVLLEQARALPDVPAWVARIQDALDHRVAAPSQAFLFLFHLGRRLAGQRILVLGAYRPDEVAAGREGQPHPLQSVVLEFGALWAENEVDLAQAQGQAFVEALVDSEANVLGAGFRDALYRQTGGHALFTVELLRGLRQRGDLVRAAEGQWTEGPALDWDRLPRRVEAVIAAHIARLPRDQQELLSVASVEGEEFHAEVAARVLETDEGQVLASLSGALSEEHRLVAAHSLRHVGQQRFSRYRFRNHLFQRYLYGRLDPVRRARLHGEVGSALEALGAVPAGAPSWQDTLEVVLDDYCDLFTGQEAIVSEGMMARHWEEAGLAEKAALYHRHALRRAMALSYAYEEMLVHVTRAIDLLATLPESSQRMRWEILSYRDLSEITSHIKGQIAPEVGHAIRQSIARAEEIGDTLLVVDGLVILSWYHRHCGELDLALSLNERAIALGQSVPPEWMAQARGGLAQTLMHRGEFAASANLWQPLINALLSTASIVPEDAGSIQGHVPWTLWCLGYPDRALRASRGAMEVVLRETGKARVGEDVHVLCEDICFIHQLRREVGDVERGLQLLLPTVEEHRCAPFLWPYATLYLGWVQAQRGELEQGIETLRRGLAEWSQQLVVMRPYWKGYLAEALGRAGRADEGLQVLAEALEQAERTNERFNEAELWRLKGELLLQTGGPSSPALLPQTAWEKGEEETAGAAYCRADEVEACFRRAIEAARRQEAKSWELRAATSLARLLQTQGRLAEAGEMLSAIYGWFTEGFDTPDLVEAKALLERLQDTTSSQED